MQIISGAHRGRKLYLPDGARPTQNRARVALFNMLTPIVPRDNKFIVWDAFAGSGAFGLEFLSRYANVSTVFTDIAPDTVIKNLNAVGASATVKQTDAMAAIPQFGADADIIFVDPPYSGFDIGVKFVCKMSGVAKPGAILIWEIEQTREMPNIGTNWQIIKDKTYGRARFLILQHI